MLFFVKDGLDSELNEGKAVQSRKANSYPLKTINKRENNEEIFSICDSADAYIYAGPKG